MSSVRWVSVGFCGRVLGPLEAWRVLRSSAIPLEAWWIRGACLGLLEAWRIRRLLGFLWAWRVLCLLFCPLESWRVWGACPRSHGGMAGSGGCPRSPAGVAGSGGVSVPWWRGEFWGFLLGFIGAWRVDRVSSVSSWSVGFLGRVLGPLRRAGLGASRAPGGVANLESVYSVFWGCGGFGGMFWSPGAVPAAGALSLVPWRVAG